jgi:hypothetical protein
MSWNPIVTVVRFRMPITAHPPMVVTGRNRPITRMVYVTTAFPDKLAFDPYVTGRRLNRVYINGYRRGNVHIEVNLCICDVSRQDHPQGQHR